MAELIRRIPDPVLDFTIWKLTDEEQKLLNAIQRANDEIDEEEKMFKRWNK